MQANEVKTAFDAAMLMRSAPGKNHNLARLSKTLNTNQFDLKTIFRVVFGTTIYQYLIKARMEKATIEIKTSSKLIYEIAEEYGYANAEYFTRIFKQHTGVTPSKLRS